MDKENLYASPGADVDIDDSDSELAGRWSRLWGAIIDGIAISLVFIPILFALGYYENIEEQMASTSSALAANTIPALGYIVLYVLFNGYLLHTSGQTIGKRVVGTRIVSVKDGRILPLSRVVFLRFLPFSIVAYVPLIGPFIALANNLAIFTSQRRCLHDYLAATKVIKA
ncbi:MAG: RDD family protein [Pseudomonadota bacterium]